MPPKTDKKSSSNLKTLEKNKENEKKKAIEAKTKVIHMHHHHFHHNEKDYTAKHKGNAEIRTDPPRRYPGYVARDPLTFHHDEEIAAPYYQTFRSRNKLPNVQM